MKASKRTESEQENRNLYHVGEFLPGPTYYTALAHKRLKSSSLESSLTPARGGGPGEPQTNFHRYKGESPLIMVIVLLRLLRLYGYGQFCLKARSLSALSCRVPFRFWFLPVVARDVFHAFHHFCPRPRPQPEVPGRGGGAGGSLVGAPGPRSAVCSLVAASIIITSAWGSPRRVLPAPARHSPRASKQNMLDCSEMVLGVWGQKGCSQTWL